MNNTVSMNVKAALLSCAIIISVTSSPAFATATAEGVFPLEISRIGDVEKSCGGLSQEAGAMKEIIADKSAHKQTASMQENGITAIAGVGSFLAGTLTGGIGFAAAGFIAGEAVDSSADKADEIMDIAAQRRSLMVGIFKAKGCYGPIDHVMLDDRAASIAAADNMATLAPAAGPIKRTPMKTAKKSEIRYNE